MNKFPIIDMLAFYSRHRKLKKPEWRPEYTHQLKRIRSCYSKTDGGVRKSYYTIETKSEEIIDLTYDEENLIWSLAPSEAYPNHSVDCVLALIRRYKHTPSRAHRIIPYRFEIFPKSAIEKRSDRTEIPLVNRLQPYRFQSGKLPSTQVTGIVTRHLENIMVTKHLHYVAETDQGRFYHLVFILDESDWRLMQEVDEEFFFVR